MFEIDFIIREQSISRIIDYAELSVLILIERFSIHITYLFESMKEYNSF